MSSGMADGSSSRWPLPGCRQSAHEQLSRSHAKGNSRRKPSGHASEIARPSITTSLGADVRVWVIT